MIDASRRWFRRNRTNIAIATGLAGATYLAGQYVVGKIQEARQRMTDERIAKENLRRRFEQNQEDCTYTVLALLPTVRDEILSALPVEQITEQLQQERQERLRRAGASEAASTDYPSVPPSVTANDDDSKSLSSSSYVHASQMASSSLNPGIDRSSRKTKAQLWQDMKINAITRALTLIYTLSLLTLFTRIQLNLLGRRTYLSSVVALASPRSSGQGSISLENRDDDGYDNVYGNDFEINRQYLTFSWWLLHRGSKQMLERVMEAVKAVFGPVNIREDMTLERLSELILEVRKKIEGETEQERKQMKWLSYLLPPREEEAFVMRQAGASENGDSPSPEVKPDFMTQTPDDEEAAADNLALRRLLDETSDLVDSPIFSQVLTRVLDAAYSNLVDVHIASECFKIPPTTARVTELPDTETKVKLAHILPIFCRQAHVIAAGSGEMDVLSGVAAQEGVRGNEYLGAVDAVHDVEAFAAVIYSSNFEFEVDSRQSGSGAEHVQSTASRAQEENVAGMSYLEPEQEPEVDEEEAAGEVPSSLEKAASAPESETKVSTEEQPPAYTEEPTEESTGGSLEEAWKRALATEDGTKASAPDASEAPVPVQDD